MAIDYKINRIIEGDNSTTVRISIYAGVKSALMEDDGDGQKMVDRYRRSSKLAVHELTIPGRAPQDRILKALNERLKASYPAETPIPEQVNTVPVPSDPSYRWRVV